ncbi:MAG: hypothetical protein VX470_07010 [Planctomycetota bacterium]|nr:hypothetical protein [Planctomycetota bacterium]
MPSKLHYTVINISETTQFTKMRQVEIHRGERLLQQQADRIHPQQISIASARKINNRQANGKIPSVTELHPEKTQRFDIGQD